MQQNQRYQLDNNERSGFKYAWLVGVIVVLALLLLWYAFNRAEQDVLPTAAEQAEEARQKIEATAQNVAEEAADKAEEVATDAKIAAARGEARLKLLVLQAELEAGAAYDEVEQDINEIEANLKTAYTDTSTELQSEYQVIQEELELLKDSIQNGTGDALEGVANLSLMLEAEVRSGE